MGEVYPTIIRHTLTRQNQLAQGMREAATMAILVVGAVLAAGVGGGSCGDTVIIDLSKISAIMVFGYVII